MTKPPLILPVGYEVTREGQVFSTRRGARKELKQWLNGSGHGYPAVFLYDRDKQGRRRKRFLAVYRLVALVYLPPKPEGRHIHVLHIDGDRMNSHADNLRWGTASENTYDMWRHRRALEKPTVAAGTDDTWEEGRE